jgi:acetyltransferase
MAEYPAQLVREHALSDGRTVTIRPVRVNDYPLERTFLNELSPESRYLRFQKCVNAPSDRLVHFLTDVDYDRHMAVVCTTAGPGGEELVGEARYVAATDRGSCEFGIMIADGWHRTGVAGLLMEALTRAARERGIAEMEGQVLASNAPMLRFARALGFEVQQVAGDPRIRRVVKKL